MTSKTLSRYLSITTCAAKIRPMISLSAHRAQSHRVPVNFRPPSPEDITIMRKRCRDPWFTTSLRASLRPHFYPDSHQCPNPSSNFKSNNVLRLLLRPTLSTSRLLSQRTPPPRPHRPHLLRQNNHHHRPPTDFPTPHSLTIHADDFYKPDSEIPVKDGVQDWDCAGSLDLQKFEGVLRRVKEGGEALEGLVRQGTLRGDGWCAWC